MSHAANGKALAKSIPNPSTKDSSVGIWLEPSEVVTMLGLTKKGHALKFMQNATLAKGLRDTGD